MTIHAGDSPGKLVTTRPRPPGDSAVGWKLLTSIAESSDDAIIGKTLDGVVTTWNKSAERIYGYRAEEMIGHSVSLLIPPGLSGEMDEIMDRVRAGDRADHYETRRRRKDGVTIAVSLTVSPVHDASGQVVGASAIARDDTDLKRAESEIAGRETRHARALPEAHRRTEVAYDRDGRPAGRGRKHTRTGTIKPAGTPPGHPPDAADLPDPADNARTTRSLLADAEERQQLKDTQLAVFNILEDATTDQLRAEAAVKASIDILDELSAAQAEIRALNAELEVRVDQRTAELVAANKNLEAFAYSVAHDLRSPLRALSGYSEALTEDYADRLDDTGRSYTERIQTATERMGTLIDDLLMLAQVSRTDMNLEAVDLSAEVTAISAELHDREPGRAVRFAIADGVRATADRSLIRTVLENLVENAWKFTAKRTDATIEFGATAAGDSRVCCYVRDNGAGFDPAFTAKLFQPFQRLHAVTDFPGTGIGLSSVQRIVERHGGRVWAEGVVDHGATFYFTLNRTQAP
jgi:PAS domain S-box-containing protein